MKPLSLPVLAAVAVAAANFSAAPAQAAKFRICKNVSATGVDANASFEAIQSEIGAAR